MIKVGVDIVENKRVIKLFKAYDTKFLQKFLSSEEISCWLRRGKKMESLCGLFAAKEAVVKCLNNEKTNFLQIKVFYKNNIPQAKYKNFSIPLSISHEKSYSVAVAICD